MTGPSKLDRHKYGYFPADVRTRAQTDELLGACRWVHLHEFEVSEVVELVAEYRVLCLHGRSLAGSGYRVGHWWWEDGDTEIADQAHYSAPDDMIELASCAAAQLGDPAVSVDVGSLPAAPA